MKHLPRIMAAYAAANAHFVREKASIMGNDVGNLARIAEKQRINSLAYYLLCWGQLEAEIDHACRRAIRKGGSQKNWRERRGWELYNPDDKRLSGLSFEERASLVIERRSPAWRLLMRHYALRNKIAHGAELSETVHVQQAAEDFYAIQAAITD